MLFRRHKDDRWVSDLFTKLPSARLISSLGLVAVYFSIQRPNQAESIFFNLNTIKRFVGCQPFGKALYVFTVRKWVCRSRMNFDVVLIITEMSLRKDE